MVHFETIFFDLQLFSAGVVEGYPVTSWNKKVSNTGEALYCLTRYNDSLIFEANLDSLSKVTMIGSEVRMVALTYQNFEVKYSIDGVTWSSYEQGWNLTVGYKYY